jgi:hypothetical protein
MSPDGPAGKAKRFDVLARWAGNRKDESTGDERDAWRKRQEEYREQRDKYEARYENQHDDSAWPSDVTFTEFMYHEPGPHVHMATTQRNKLIELAKIANDDFKCRVGEFPPFDPVECVHVWNSWHYRDSSNPWTARTCANRGDGLAADVNDWDGGSDQEYAFFIECKRRYL